MNLKQPLTIKQQVARLGEHSIVVEDENVAEEVLSEINYYRFTGYALQFRKDENDSDLVSEIQFNDILQIYRLDEELRNLSRKYLEKVEVFFRTQIAYNFSLLKCNREPHDQHYYSENYGDEEKFNEVLESFYEHEKYYFDSLVFQHHDKSYSGKMPLWVIVEYLSFSNLSKLFNAMDNSTKGKIADKLNSGPDLLSNNLHCLSVFRNKCAHAARLYNEKFSPPAKFNKSFLVTYPSLRNDTFLAYFVVLIKRLPNITQKKACRDAFISIINNYKKKNIDVSYLGLFEGYEELLDKLVI